VRGLQLRQVGVPAYLHPALELHAHIEDPLDLAVEHRLGESIARDPVAQHSAGLLQRLEDRHAIASAGQLIGAGEPAGAGSDDGDLLRLLLIAELLERQVVLDPVVADRPLDLVDADRALELRAVALGLAGGRADTTTHRGERAGVRVDVPGFLERLVDRFL
jgi:hypothetical protein